MEWAWDARGIHVLQVRPLTACHIPDDKAANRPFHLASLYTDTALPEKIPLGECEEVYRYYVRKRSRAFRLAAEMGVPTGGAYVLGLTATGLAENRQALDRLLQATPAHQVVIDLNPNVRQIIIPKAAAFEFLVDTFGSAGRDHHAVIVRDYIKGDLGFISCLVRSGQDLLLEYSRDGLMAMNRGTAHSGRIRVPVGSASETADCWCDCAENLDDSLRAVLPTVINFTRALTERTEATQLEWVLAEGRPFFVDFSREHERVRLYQEGQNLRISGGVAQGPAFVLPDDAELQALSVGPAISVGAPRAVVEHQYVQRLIDRLASLRDKPVIVARRPWAILSILFDYVAGFVFLEGSLLCHLAILLREQQVPAVICGEMDVSSGSELTLVGTQVIVLDGRESST
jgi:hypothetical protein